MEVENNSVTINWVPGTIFYTLQILGFSAIPYQPV